MIILEITILISAIITAMISISRYLYFFQQKKLRDDRKAFYDTLDLIDSRADYDKYKQMINTRTTSTIKIHHERKFWDILVAHNPL